MRHALAYFITARAVAAASLVAVSLAPAIAVLGLLNLIFMASPSFAAPITYIEEATASGSLGGAAFSNADIVFSMTGDTTNVITTTASPGEIIDHNSGTVTVSVAGGMPAAFSDGGAVFFNHGVGAFAPTIGFSNDVAFFYISSVAANGYDLRTPIGPLSGTAHIFPGVPLDTAGGTFILTSASSTATFTATTSGTVMGDPHFTTYDGLHYDFQAAGDFVLTRSTQPGNSFDVQIRTRAPSDGSAVTIVSAVAAKLGDHRVTFDLDRASAGGSFVWIDGRPKSFEMHNPILALDAGRIIQLSPDHYQVIWKQAKSWTSPTPARFLMRPSGFRRQMGPGRLKDCSEVIVAGAATFSSLTAPFSIHGFR